MMHETQHRFEFEELEQADIYVTERFVNAYNDERAVLDGETYEAKEIIKFDWNTTHHDFDGNRKAWIVDADALDELEERLNDAGYSTDFEPREFSSESASLSEAIDVAELNAHVEVRYAKKTGGGTSSFEGRVCDAHLYDEKIQFRRYDDSHLMWVTFDEYGNVSLFTSGSHAPFVGNVDELIIDNDADRGDDE